MVLCRGHGLVYLTLISGGTHYNGDESSRCYLWLLRKNRWQKITTGFIEDDAIALEDSDRLVC